MINRFKMTMAIALTCLGSASAMAGEWKRVRSDPGLVITHRVSSDRYCIRPTTDAQARRLGMPVHTTECQTMANWAKNGLRLEPRAQAERRLSFVN